MKLMKKILLLLVACIELQGCAVSFRSTQFDLLRLAINGPNGVPVEELAWTLLWAGESYNMIPIISNDGKLANFVNEEGAIVITFDNFDSWQIINAFGLLPEELNMQINKSSSTLDYSIEDQQVLFSHACSNFVSSQVGTNTVRVQNCEDSHGEAYENQIRVNSAGQISQLLFMIHEDYPMITLTPNNLDFSGAN
jgi:hypothetical protein